jgi:muramoyltetrapeptide carboxypeptidase
MESHPITPVPRITPPLLVPGDTIFIVAPSYAIEEDLLSRNIKFIESSGFRVKFRPDIYSKHISFAGLAKRRQAEFLEALDDPEVKAIWACRGGYGASYIQDVLSETAIRTAKKWLIGFSDLTSLHCAWARAGVASLHCATVHYLERWSESARSELFSCLMGPKERSWEYQGEPVQGTNTVEGCITGGNITLLASLAGTGYLPSWKGAILVVEDVTEAPYRLDRELLQLYQAGAFQGLVGIAIGQFTDCVGSDPEDTAEKRVTGFFKEHLTLPIIAGMPFGHENSSRAVVLGGIGVLDPVKGSLHVRLSM